MPIRAFRSLACLGLLLAGSCITALTTNRASELTAVEWTLRGFNAALIGGDTARLRGLVRPDFRLIEDSTEYNLAGAVSTVAAAHASGALKRDMSDFKIEQRGLTSWATYRVRGSFASGRDTLRFGRLESAVLSRIDSHWVVAFMTSSPEPQRN